MHRLLSWLYFSALASLALGSAPAGSWDQFNYAPKSKTVYPVAIHSTVGTVKNAANLLTRTGQATISGSQSYIALDFGKEVGGLLSLDIVSAGSTSKVALSFTESPLYISPSSSDDSSSGSPRMNVDGVEALPTPLKTGLFTQPAARMRGGFRYVSIVSQAAEAVTIANVSLAITFAPHISNLTDYAGYFSAQDPSFHDVDFLTKAWYAGAYTVQTNTVDSQTSRRVVHPGWANDASAGPVKGPLLVDGAKRSRSVWPGDLGISAHTGFVSTNDLLPTRNSLYVMFTTSNPTTGALGYSGPQMSATGSDTYICWTLVVLHDYYLFSGDLSFVQSVWTNYTRAVSYLQTRVDSTGLLNVPSSMSQDWARPGGAGHNAAANALLYRTLITGSTLATAVGQKTTASGWSANATKIKTAFNKLLWDSTHGMYKDNDATTLLPQDGNSLAVLFDLPDSAAKVQSVSDGLTKFWTSIGPVTPEMADTISPFISGFELQAHFIAGNGARALDLMQREWGYMLYSDIGVQSTFWEGFTKNGSLYYRGNAGYTHDPTYNSHAHGWSTGPTPALSYYVLGLRLAAAKGQAWAVAPVLSGLGAAEGGYSTSLGWFGVKWSVTSGLLTLVVTTPSGTSGVVTMPGTGAVVLDGKSVGTTGTVSVSGGTHTLTRTQ